MPSAAIDGRVVAVLQLTCIPTLTRRGSRRAIGRARQKGCRLVQLTSDKRRRDAIRFYESLGFVASHEGMKLELAASGKD